MQTIEREGKKFNLITNLDQYKIGFREAGNNCIELLSVDGKEDNTVLLHEDTFKQILNAREAAKFENLCNELAESMVDYAGDNWQQYYDDGYPRIDQESALDEAYERLCGKEMDEPLYEQLIASKTIKKAFEDMYDLVKDQAEESRTEPFYGETMAQKMRERGLSNSMFL